MPDSYPFPTYSGLLQPKHFKQIGSALWLFLWCISSTTKEVEKDGVSWGVVLGNKPIKISELEEAFGVTNKTVRSWVKTLEQHGYINVNRAPYGLIITVKNSKKFTNSSVENDRTRPEGNYRSEDRDRKETTDQMEENYRSNKDITEDLTSSAAITDESKIYQLAQQVERHFLQRRGKGNMVSPADFSEIKKMVSAGIPVDLIKTCIDNSFADYKPRHARDEIRTITYCIPRCYDEWAKLQPDESITSPAVPSAGSVALGSRPLTRSFTRNHQQINDLQELIREERERIEVGRGC